MIMTLAPLTVDGSSPLRTGQSGLPDVEGAPGVALRRSQRHGAHCHDDRTGRSSLVISGSYDNTVRVWELATGAPIGPAITRHSGGVNAVLVAQLDGRPILITGSDDKTVRVWDLAARIHPQIEARVNA
jgi:WD40 repeat protein